MARFLFEQDVKNKIIYVRENLLKSETEIL